MSESLKEASENINDLVVTLSPKLEQAILAGCVSYLAQALTSLLMRRRRVRLLHNVAILAGAVAVLAEAMKLPFYITPAIVGALSSFMTYYELTEEDKEKSTPRIGI